MTLTPSPWRCTGPQAVDANLSLLVRHQTHRKEPPLTLSLPWGPVAPGCEGWHLAGCWGGDSGHQVPGEREAGGLQGDSSPPKQQEQDTAKGDVSGGLPASKQGAVGWGFHTASRPHRRVRACVQVSAGSGSCDKHHRRDGQPQTLSPSWTLESEAGYGRGCSSRGLSAGRIDACLLRVLTGSSCACQCPGLPLLLIRHQFYGIRTPPPTTTMTSFSLRHLCKDRISKRGPVLRCGVQGSNIHIGGRTEPLPFSRRCGHCFTWDTVLVSISRFSLSRFLEVQLYQLDFQVGRLKLKDRKRRVHRPRGSSRGEDVDAGPQHDMKMLKKMARVEDAGDREGPVTLTARSLGTHGCPDGVLCEHRVSANPGPWEVSSAGAQAQSGVTWSPPPDSVAVCVPVHSFWHLLFMLQVCVEGPAMLCCWQHL